MRQAYSLHPLRLPRRIFIILQLSEAFRQILRIPEMPKKLLIIAYPPLENLFFPITRPPVCTSQSDGTGEGTLSAAHQSGFLSQRLRHYLANIPLCSMLEDHRNTTLKFSFQGSFRENDVGDTERSKTDEKNWLQQRLPQSPVLFCSTNFQDIHFETRFGWLLYLLICLSFLCLSFIYLLFIAIYCSNL